MDDFLCPLRFSCPVFAMDLSLASYESNFLLTQTFELLNYQKIVLGLRCLGTFFNDLGDRMEEIHKASKKSIFQMPTSLLENFDLYSL